MPAPRAVPEGRRVEALRRLAVPDRVDGPALLGLLDLVRELLRADRIAVTLVDDRRARTVAERSDHPVGPEAGEGPVADVARAVSLADVVVREPDRAVRRIERDEHDAADVTTHRWWRGGNGPATLALAAITDGTGAVLGALELAWLEPDDVPDRWVDAARLASGQVTAHLTARAERDEFHRFVELAPDAIAVLDLEGELELVNPAMAALVGVDADALVGRSFLDLVVTADLARVTGALARLLAGREPTARLDAHLRRPGGRQVPVSLSAGYLAGPHRSLQVVARDLTDRLRAAEERARLTEQLAQAHRFETVGQLASGLAHDLNNLLSVLLANVELGDETIDDLAAGGPVEVAAAQLREDLDAIRSASRRVEGLTRRLLTFAADRPVTTRKVGLLDRLRSIADLVRPTLGADVTLGLEVEGELPAVEMDPIALERAVTNLVLNAREAVDPGGTIRIVARRESTGEGADVVIEVVDDGRGMTEEVRRRAFDPLFTTRMDERGTGLGLTSVLRFVEDLGGAIHLDTAPGEGTRVSLAFPASPPPTPALDSSEVGRIVLVEPAERSRQVISAMLVAGGHHVAAVADLDEVVVGWHQVRAVVLAAGDDEDPVAASPGAELATDHDLVAALGRVAPDVPIVLLTSRHDERPDGVAEVLRKPFLSERLLEAVERVSREIDRRIVPPTA